MTSPTDPPIDPSATHSPSSPKGAKPWGAGASPAAEPAAADSAAFSADALSALAKAAQQALGDAAAERKRQRRRTFWWRLATVLLLVGLAAPFLMRGAAPSAPHIARYDVFGMITEDRQRDALLEAIARDDSAAALIVRIDSPGGTTVGGEALFDSLRRVADKKPVVAVMGEVAASAGYIAAIAADHIVARGNTITASIGVIMTTPNVSGALGAVGIEMVEIKSGAQKAEPTPYGPLAADKLGPSEDMIADSFAWFLGLVADRRDLPQETLDTVSDGRILSGRMALEMNMVDAIGGEREAIDWLAETHDLARDLPVIDRMIPEEPEGLAAQLIDRMMGWAGLSRASLRLSQGPVLMSTAE